MRQGEPLNRPALDRMLAATGQGGEATAIALRDAALAAVAYDTLLRRSELVSLRIEDLGPASDVGADLGEIGEPTEVPRLFRKLAAAAASEDGTAAFGLFDAGGGLLGEGVEPGVVREDVADGLLHVGEPAASPSPELASLRREPPRRSTSVRVARPSHHDRGRERPPPPAP